MVNYDKAAHMNLAQLLEANRDSFHPVVPFTSSDRIVLIDFAEENEAHADHILNDEDAFVSYMYKKLQDDEIKYVIGGYDMQTPTYRKRLGSAEKSTIHLGIDIWGRPRTRVMAPMNGIVHSLSIKDDSRNGASLIMSHQVDGLTFFTLYGHISRNSLVNLEPGDFVARGDIFGEFGMPNENGNWPPHLHFQIIEDLEDLSGHYPGFCAYSERKKYLMNCPDPDLILNMVQFATANILKVA